MKLNNIILFFIVGITAIGGVFYLDRNEEPIPKPFTYALEQSSKKIKLTFNSPIYSGEKNWLAVMFRSAESNEQHEKQQKMFQKIIVLALAENDFNVALMAVLKMEEKEYISYEDVIKMLNLIVDRAIETRHLDYAYFAVNQYPTCSSKARMESKVIAAYIESTKEIKISTINKNIEYILS